MSLDLPAALNLTEKQAAFVAAYVEMGDQVKAAKAAGYLGLTVSGYRLLKHPAILAAIRYETAKRVQTLAPGALAVLEGIMLDPKENAKTRAYCAVQILDRAGHAPPTSKDRSADRSDRPQSEMTEAELVAMLQALQKRQAEEAELVQTEAETPHNAPNDAPITSQAIDMFE